MEPVVTGREGLLEPEPWTPAVGILQAAGPALLVAQRNTPDVRYRRRIGSVDADFHGPVQPRFRGGSGFCSRLGDGCRGGDVTRRHLAARVVGGEPDEHTVVPPVQVRVVVLLLGKTPDGGNQL